jgi:hypothetical protein
MKDRGLPSRRKLMKPAMLNHADNGAGASPKNFLQIEANKLRYI